MPRLIRPELGKGNPFFFKESVYAIISDGPRPEPFVSDIEASEKGCGELLAACLSVLLTAVPAQAQVDYSVAERDLGQLRDSIVEAHGGSWFAAARPALPLVIFRQPCFLHISVDGALYHRDDTQTLCDTLDRSGAPGKFDNSHPHKLLLVLCFSDSITLDV